MHFSEGEGVTWAPRGRRSPDPVDRIWQSTPVAPRGVFPVKRGSARCGPTRGRLVGRLREEEVRRAGQREDADPHEHVADDQLRS